MKKPPMSGRNSPASTRRHVLFFGRKENFWQMAETGPCGPCSEIHIDLGEEHDNLRGTDHLCGVNGECTRYLELWNNVFIQYNLFPDGRLEPLPARHVDTGMGFERIVSVLQGVDSNYKTDLFAGSLDVLSSLTGRTREQMYADFTPYRVIADHARSAAFLIADGVVPGNAGRNYITRMIIRRAARFGTKIGLHEPFLAKVAEAVIAEYSGFYPELKKSSGAILDNLTREELRFARTIEVGYRSSGESSLPDFAPQTKPPSMVTALLTSMPRMDFPLRSRAISRVNKVSMWTKKDSEPPWKSISLASGGGKAMGKQGGEDAEFFAGILRDLQKKKKLGEHGVDYDPYTSPRVEGEVLAIIVDGQSVHSASFGDQVEILLPKTGFYIESGGQVNDEGYIKSLGVQANGRSRSTNVRRASAGVIVHVGEVVSGQPKVGDLAIAEVDMPRRHDIMRNHTATHLLHAALHQVLGEHAVQAGSLVAPDRLRFDFNHPEAMTPEQIERVERIVNDAVAADMEVLPKLHAREGRDCRRCHGAVRRKIW